MPDHTSPDCEFQSPAPRHSARTPPAMRQRKAFGIEARALHKSHPALHIKLEARRHFVWSSQKLQHRRIMAEFQLCACTKVQLGNSSDAKGIMQGDVAPQLRAVAERDKRFEWSQDRYFCYPCTQSHSTAFTHSGWSMRFDPPIELRSRGGLHLAERELNAWGRSKHARGGGGGAEERPWTSRQRHRPLLATARCPQQPTSTLAASSRKSNTRSSWADFRQKGYAPTQGLESLTNTFRPQIRVNDFQ